MEISVQKEVFRIQDLAVDVEQNLSAHNKVWYRFDMFNLNTVNSKLRLNSNFLAIQFATFLSYYNKITQLIRIPLFRRKILLMNDFE